MSDDADDHVGKADDNNPASGGHVRRPAYQPGDLVRVTIGNVAHGGHCVARDGNVVIFVRHALPGEDATVRITQTARSYARAEVIDADFELRVNGTAVPATASYRPFYDPKSERPRT